MPDLKLTMMNVRDRHHFDISELERSAMVPMGTVRNMLIGTPVNAHNARAVLGVLSAGTGEIYTLDTVDVSLLSQE